MKVLEDLINKGWYLANHNPLTNKLLSADNMIYLIDVSDEQHLLNITYDIDGTDYISIKTNKINKIDGELVCYYTHEKRMLDQREHNIVNEIRKQLALLEVESKII